MLRRFLLIGLMTLTLTACTLPEAEDRPAVDLGDFRLGYAIVVAKNAQKIPPTRAATAEEWEAVLKEEIAARFGGHEGARLYHIAVSVDGYALAVPGVPVVVSPKSAMAISVNLWDDAAGGKLNDKPKQMTVLESLSANTVIGSGLTTSREEQMRNLARNAARAIEAWLVENRAAWFAAGEAGAEATEPPPEASGAN
ncbi:hypothetical protein [Actibacterium sp. MT2.3-13A]|uniref:hypothetical protein n=1 Tax=Actibacterium sp. MT2.3-13A TaxID=2828332 RepID=UPI001BAC1F6E|nr:hypothetical protein [Actibacterium sp. MT2.3-13A]